MAAIGVEDNQNGLKIRINNLTFNFNYNQAKALANSINKAIQARKIVTKLTETGQISMKRTEVKELLIKSEKVEKRP